MSHPSAGGHAQQQALRLEQEARQWGCNPVPEAPREGELPVLDASPLLQRRTDSCAVADFAEQLRRCFDSTGFFLLANHGCETVVEQTLNASKAFHTVLTDDEKEELAFNDRGVGYIRVNNRILPRREKGNMNEAFIVKREHGPRNVTLDSNPWPREQRLPGFKAQVLEYAACMEQLALRLLPAFALALDLPEHYFEAAFADPLFRLRLSRYPPVHLEPGQFGIAPHVDTTFFTLLAQDGAGGLCVQAPDGRWLSVPGTPRHLVVNTGELLRQWSNHRVPSTRHYAVNRSGVDRYSIPFFFNATADYRMVCLPSCTSPDNPPKYPPTSFLESQGTAQRE